MATIVSIGCDIAHQGIAAPANIDRAVVSGVGPGLPRGPLAWSGWLGAATVIAPLINMLGLGGDPRCRASPWLRRRAAIGVSLLRPEA